MATIGALVVDLKAETAAFRSDMEKARSALDSSTARMRRSLTTLEKGFKSLQAVAKNFVAALAVALATMGGAALLKMADSFRLLQARIENVTKATGDYAGVSRALADIAIRTGTSLESNVDVFQRLSFGAKDLGKSNQDVLKLVNIVDQLGVVSGASTTALNAGLLQFGQAMSAGIVRAEEFNSIIENLPALANRIAQGLGVSTGQLRQLVLDGKVLSKDVFEALLKQADDVQQEFNQMPVTMGRAMNALKISFTELVGGIDNTYQVTQTLANGIQGLSQFLNENHNALIAVATAVRDMASVAINLTIEVVKASMAFQALKNLLELLNIVFIDGLNPLQQFAVGLVQVAGFVDTVSVRTQQAKNNIESFGKTLQNFYKYAGTGQFTAVQASTNQTNALANQALESQLAKRQLGRMGQILDIATIGSVSAVSGIGGPGADFAAQAKKKKGSKSDAEKEMDRLKARAEDLTKSLRTVWEKYIDDMREVENLSNKHLITQETVKRRVAEIQEEFNQNSGIRQFFDSVANDVKQASDALTEVNKMMDDFNQKQQERANSIIESTKTQAERLQETIQELNDLYLSGRVNVDEYATAHDRLTEQLKEAQSTGIDAAKELEQVFVNFGRNFEDTLIESFKSGKFAFKDMIASMLEDLARHAIRVSILMPIFNAMSNTKFVQNLASGSLFKGIGSGIGKIFGFADGGVASGLSLVGEKGPELVNFGSPSRVFSNQESQALLAGGGGGSITLNQYFTIQALDGASVKEVLAKEKTFIQKMTMDGLQKHENKMGRYGPLDNHRRGK